MFERPIVQLPLTHPEVIRINFSKEERALYQVLEERFRRDFNRYVLTLDLPYICPSVVMAFLATFKLVRLREITAIC